MKTFPIPAPDGLQLAAALETPETPQAVLVLVHGMAEHKERYFPFMTYLAEKGFACLITDLRGHGATVTDKADLGHFDKKGDELLVADTLAVVRYAKDLYPGKKVFLMGHSMGSLIVRCFTKRYDSEIDGLVVCGSPSRNGAAGTGILLTRLIALFKGRRYRSKFLENMATGGYNKRFAQEGDNAWLSTNKANVQAYNNDTLCGFPFTVLGYQGLLGLMEETYDVDDWNVTRPELPIHFIAGADDPCIVNIRKFSRAVSFIRARGYRTVTSKVYPDLRHEILNEIGKEDVWRDVAALLKSWL